jgi:hypothetical protein
VTVESASFCVQPVKGSVQAIQERVGDYLTHSQLHRITCIKGFDDLLNEARISRECLGNIQREKCFRFVDVVLKTSRVPSN